MFKHQNIFLNAIPAILSAMDGKPSALMVATRKPNKVTTGLSY